MILPNKFSVRIKHDEKFWVLILTKKFSVRIKHEWKLRVSILTNNFAVSIKSFYMLESFRNNWDIYNQYRGCPKKRIGLHSILIIQDLNINSKSEKLNTSRILEPSPSPRPQVQATWFLVTYIWTWKAESWWFQWISFFPAYHLTIGTGKIWTKTLLVFVTLPIIFRFAINIFPAIPVKIRYCEKATKIWPIFLVSFEPTKGQKGPKQIVKPAILPKTNEQTIFHLTTLQVNS